MANIEQEKEQKPLDRRTLAFVAAFRKYRDIYRAAERAHVPKNQAVRLFNSPAFQEELDRQDEAVRTERAKQEVRVEQLTNDLLDRTHVAILKLDPEKHGSVVLEGLRLGNVITGRIQAGNTRSLEYGIPRGGEGEDAVAAGTVTVVHAQVTMEERARQATAAAPIMGEQSSESARADPLRSRDSAASEATIRPAGLARQRGEERAAAVTAAAPPGAPQPAGQPTPPAVPQPARASRLGPARIG